MQFTKVHQKLAKPVYEAIPKIVEKAGKKWEWEPEAGEFFLCKTEYMDQGKTIQYDRLMLVPLEFRIEVNVYTGQSLIINNERISLEACVPLLHWERIMKILERMGYDVTVTYEGGEELDKRGYCNIWKDGEYKIEDKRGKDCQEAVQRATLALVEEKQ